MILWDVGSHIKHDIFDSSPIHRNTTPVHYHHQSFMELGHLLTRSGLTPVHYGPFIVIIIIIIIITLRHVSFVHSTFFSRKVKVHKGKLCCRRDLPFEINHIKY